MMNYKKMMGYGDKKKVTKKESKPKVNEVLKSIKEEFGFIKEVGAAPQYKKHLFNIKKAENNYEDAIMDFKKFLITQDNKSEAKEMSSKFVTIVGKFQKWFEREIVRMIRKSI